MKGRKKTQKRQQPMRFKGWFFAEVFLLFFFNVFFFFNVAEVLKRVTKIESSQFAL